MRTLSLDTMRCRLNRVGGKADHLEKASSSVTVGELCDRVATEFNRRLKNQESSQRHYTSMRETLKRFRAKFDSVPIKVLRGTTIKAWLALELERWFG
jgi:hypothetical protein